MLTYDSTIREPAAVLEAKPYVDRDFFCMHSDLCKTLANDKRQMILGALRDGELSVSELAEVTGIPQANLSQHLATMRTRGVVRTRRDGSRVFYEIANPKLIQAFDLITEVMREAMDERSRAAGSDGD
jgi:ArsR family transcriptional regulator